MADNQHKETLPRDHPRRQHRRRTWSANWFEADIAINGRRINGSVARLGRGKEEIDAKGQASLPPACRTSTPI